MTTRFLDAVTVSTGDEVILDSFTFSDLDLLYFFPFLRKPTQQFFLVEEISGVRQISNRRPKLHMFTGIDRSVQSGDNTTYKFCLELVSCLHSDTQSTKLQVTSAA